MFTCTFIYMYIWVYTGEVNAKRLRENYLQAVLRQDIAYFDNVGAGEVTTRIQTDTRELLHLSLSLTLTLTDFRILRLGTTRNFGKSCTRCQLRRCFHHRFLPCLYPVMATRPCPFFNSPLHCHYGWSHEQIRFYLYAVRIKSGGNESLIQNPVH